MWNGPRNEDHSKPAAAAAGVDWAAQSPGTRTKDARMPCLGWITLNVTLDSDAQPSTHRLSGTPPEFTGSAAQTAPNRPSSQAISPESGNPYDRR